MKALRKTAILIAATFTIGGGMTAIPAAPAQAKTRYVWIAPKHGKKYHYAKHCRGLNHASKLKHVTLKWAKRNHYKLCGWED
ncbi:hypothetical protein OXT66_03375 [Lentilactobacillus senioris]|uniref:hypothetical protein n=1 Tax=Lentilactobacillus senioris TaxID=931534 RepID=UPI00227FDAC7|nr:hypothetical protein [Lentilactobacillus senioris]MCY9806591.1 hypothetical protein [Lentilactobacillus senioris]